MDWATFNAIRYGCLMACVTVVGLMGLVAFIQERNWPLVALFCVAVPAAAAITARIIYVAIWHRRR